jgi:hypothetical protein
MLHYTIIKFDLNDVPKVCHFKSIKKSFMSFSSAKSSCYTAKEMLLSIQYSLNLFQTFLNYFHNVLKTLLYMFTKHFKY